VGRVSRDCTIYMVRSNNLGCLPFWICCCCCCGVIVTYNLFIPLTDPFKLPARMPLLSLLLFNLPLSSLLPPPGLLTKFFSSRIIDELCVRRSEEKLSLCWFTRIVFPPIIFIWGLEFCIEVEEILTLKATWLQVQCIPTIFSCLQDRKGSCCNCLALCRHFVEPYSYNLQ